MESITFFPKGVCSRQYDIQYEDNKIVDIQIIGGCNGNLKAIAKLCEGQQAEQIIVLLQGNTCGMRNTSCADQLTKAISSALN